MDTLFLRPKAAACVLGVSRATLYRWVLAGIIPAPTRIGGVVGWRKCDIDVWLSAQCAGTAGEK